ncbi:hypothetical protein MA16_Dca010179 [Dendrobium catenatum]|uniref:Uncharacterized protein n=1 Tax=Dendrobium catenatum TaxID=906689 RepID=A0A2I0WAC1_9ASPA|nr:hypothetical protein MA16_Dca010179 [Dendrobium catenatum]
MVVRRSSDGCPTKFRRWSDEVPAMVRRSSGGNRGRASSFSSCLDPPFVKNEGSIYSFSGVA